MMLTNEELAKMQALAEAASLGPWVYYEVNLGMCKDVDGVEKQVILYNVRQDVKPNGPRWVVAAMMMTDDLDDEIKEQASKNGPFIAAARTFVPIAVEEIRWLRELVKTAYEEGARHGERSELGWVDGERHGWEHSETKKSLENKT